ncbi:MAG TPA: SAF domain-containing protein [Kineosporiaceae bacterium]
MTAQVGAATSRIGRGRAAGDADAAAGGRPLPVGMLPRRRRWGMASLGVLLVVVGAVVAFLLVDMVGVTHPYLAVAREVPYGATIGPEDLVVVQLNAPAGLRLIPADQQAQVIGRQAATQLFAGTPLTLADVADRGVPAPGQQVVGMQLKPGQVPARALRVGEPVVLVVVPPSSVVGVPDAQGGTGLSTITATVAGAEQTATDGSVRVDVAVAAVSGPRVASMAVAGRIVLVATGGGR